MKKLALLLFFSFCAVNLSGTSFLDGLGEINRGASGQPKSIIARVVDALPNEEVACCTEMLKEVLYTTISFIPVGIACWFIMDLVDSSSPINQ